MRVLYLYWMKNDPDRVRTIAPEHASYWRDLGLPGYLGGPLADRSGGLITFEADSLEQAEGIIAADPFVREELLESSVVKEWMPE
ncbi:MAG TPA: YciI family protein [Actinomycetota bacterium]|nr:YciI family protein [Actinomycetota bacterium]